MKLVTLLVGLVVGAWVGIKIQATDQPYCLRCGALLTNDVGTRADARVVRPAGIPPELVKDP